MTSTPIRCPFCGRQNDSHGEVHKPLATPQDGDLAVCWGCRRVSVFEAGPWGLRQRQPTADEQAEIGSDPRVGQAVAAMAFSQSPLEALDQSRRSRS